MLQDEVLLIEHQNADGSFARIYYRNGGLVDAAALERLCEKVRPCDVCCWRCGGHGRLQPQQLHALPVQASAAAPRLQSLLPSHCRALHPRSVAGAESAPPLRLCVLPWQVGWPHRPLAKVETALANSFLTSCLLLRVTQAGSEPEPDELIGLARATSDHVFNATIWDVLVDPEYQV